MNIIRSFLAAAALLTLPGLVQSETYYFHNDHLGTPQDLTDDTQQVVWLGENQPFGEVIESVNTVGQNMRFPGQYLDVETGLYYNYFRIYDPSVGRYSQSDPIGLNAGVNTYAYALNNPMVFFDLNGLDITITLYPGAGKFGHLGIGVNSTQTYGHYTDGTSSIPEIVLGNWVSGETKLDTANPISSIILPTTAAQDKAIQDAIDLRLHNSGRYNLYERSCSTFVRDALSAAGILTPDLITPGALFEWLRTNRTGGPSLLELHQGI